MRSYSCSFICLNEKLNKESINYLEKVLKELVDIYNVKNFLFYNLNNIESNAYKILNKIKNTKKTICKKSSLYNNKYFYKEIVFDNYKDKINNNKNLIDKSDFCIFLNTQMDLVHLYNSQYFELLSYANSKNKFILFI